MRMRPRNPEKRRETYEWKIGMPLDRLNALQHIADTVDQPLEVILRDATDFHNELHAARQGFGWTLEAWPSDFVDPEHRKSTTPHKLAKAHGYQEKPSHKSVIKDKITLEIDPDWYDSISLVHASLRPKMHPYYAQNRANHRAMVEFALNDAADLYVARFDAELDGYYFKRRAFEGLFETEVLPSIEATEFIPEDLE